MHIMHMHQDVHSPPSHAMPMSDDDQDIGLESLSKHNRPCLAAGHFSVFNCLDVVHVCRNGEINYKLVMDGIVGISRYVILGPIFHFFTTCIFRKLSAFRVCDFGEARAYHDAPIQNAYRVLESCQSPASLMLSPPPPSL